MSGLNFNQNIEWSKLQTAILRELAVEYRNILLSFRVKLRPVAIQLFESTVLWGKWDPVVRTIFISRKLIEQQSWFNVVNILKHEMAHQWVDEQVDETDMGVKEGPHGALFRRACDLLRVPEEFTRSEVRLLETELDWRKMTEREERVQKLLERTRKLLALATSSNEHEALVAMSKVRELYAKYDLDQAQLGKKTYSQLQIETGKARMEDHTWRIQSLLCAHFMVHTIAVGSFDPKSGKRTRAVELVGTRENLLMAEYVYHFLHQQLDFWVRERAKAQKHFGRVERRSFRIGILEGFSDQLLAMEAPASQTASGGSRAGSAGDQNNSVSLVGAAVEKFGADLAQRKFYRWLHPNISHHSHGGRGFDRGSYENGHQIGQSIQLRKGIETRGGNSGRALGYTP